MRWPANEARRSVKWHGQAGRGVMDKHVGKIGWSDAIGTIRVW